MLPQCYQAVLSQENVVTKQVDDTNRRCPKYHQRYITEKAKHGYILKLGIKLSNENTVTVTVFNDTGTDIFHKVTGSKLIPNDQTEQMTQLN